MSEETKEIILSYLKENKVNPLILENPSSNIIFEIEQYLKMRKVDPEKDKISPHLGFMIHVDDRGNVKLVSQEKQEMIEGKERFFRLCSAYEIADNQELKISKSYKSSSVDKNEFGQYHCSFDMTQNVYDQYGIEQSRNINQFLWHKDSMIEAQSLAKSDFFPTQDDFSQRMKENPSCTSLKKITRNWDLGSACVELRGKGYTRQNDKINCLVQLYGEHIQNLDLCLEGSQAILSFYQNHYNSGRVDSNSKFLCDILLEYRESIPALHFRVSDLDENETDNYYDWVNAEISHISNSITRERMMQLARERNIISSKERQANAIIEQMANGTMDIDGSILSNQGYDTEMHTRTMGFGGMWLLGLITGILSCGIILLGFFLK